MSAMASRITSPTIVYSTVYSRRKSKKASKLRVTGLCVGNSPVTGDISAQMSSNAENVSIWWRHHIITRLCWSTLVQVTTLCRTAPSHCPNYWWYVISWTDPMDRIQWNCVKYIMIFIQENLLINMVWDLVIPGKLQQFTNLVIHWL